MSTTAQAAPAAPAGAAGAPFWGRHPEQQSGPRVARLFARALSLVALVAWLSLASQVRLLVGARGLEPARELFSSLRALGLGFWEAPSLFWLAQGDALLLAGTLCGAALALLSLAGVRPRLCFALSAPLYLSYASACGDFTSFQWDNMLVEVLVLAACLPEDRPAPLAHFALRALLFKLYFESGIAKWQSPLHDWQDGSAMRYYYETAPLPATLAWYAHHLPPGYHRFESWGALVLELIVPLLIWGPRPARLVAFGAFTWFQVVDTATANYGFFTYLSAILHLFLLCDRDVERAGDALRRLLRLRPRAPVAAVAAPLPAAPAPHAALRRFGARTALGLWLAASTLGALLAFSRSAELQGAVREAYGPIDALRVANVYHLFGHITRQRIEPQFETEVGERWTEHDMRYKPGRVTCAAPYVAPHQPRVDFLLWFYGLSFRRGMPRYVDRLLDRLCHDPRVVQPLFSSKLPAAPRAVRIAFYRYHMSSAQQRARSGAYWVRERLGHLQARSCD